jgi:hypothetical protein
MCEGERKEKHKSKVISRIALVAGFVAFWCSLMIFPIAYFFSDALVSQNEQHVFF